MATVDLGKISFTQKGTYVGGTTYEVKDVVQYTDNNETSSFVKINSSASGQAPQTNGTVNSSHWAIFAKGVSIASNYQSSAWASGTTYDKGDIVQYTDSGVVSTYLCTANSSQGNAPSTSGTPHADWSFLAKGTAAAGISWQSVVTASTLTAVAGQAYPIDTTSNTCTITLPAGSAGNRILFKDYASTWATNKILLNANGTEKITGIASSEFFCSQNGGAIEVVYIDATQGWVPVATNNTTDLRTEGVEWLCIAGGGGSSYDNGGGGGAGGMRYGEIDYYAGRTYTIVIGNGGSAGTAGNGGWASQGGNSTFSGTGVNITCDGGGKSSTGGATGDLAGGSGGGSSQGGGSGGATDPITQETYENSSSQGNAGGDANDSSGGGAGGGGAGGVGKNISGSTGQASVGHGGEALQNSITGSAVYYAGGGGGGANQSSQSYFGNGGNSTVTANKGGGGNGGGGSGSGTAGSANTGGGAGGGGQGGDGAAGGSGVFITKMKSSRYGSSTGSPTVDTSSVSGYTILTFTGNGTFTTA